MRHSSCCVVWDFSPSSANGLIPAAPVSSNFFVVAFHDLCWWGRVHHFETAGTTIRMFLWMKHVQYKPHSKHTIAFHRMFSSIWRGATGGGSVNSRSLVRTPHNFNAWLPCDRPSFFLLNIIHGLEAWAYQLQFGVFVKWIERRVTFGTSCL